MIILFSVVRLYAAWISHYFLINQFFLEYFSAFVIVVAMPSNGGSLGVLIHPVVLLTVFPQKLTSFISSVISFLFLSSKSVSQVKECSVYKLQSKIAN